MYQVYSVHIGADAIVGLIKLIVFLFKKEIVLLEKNGFDN